MATLSKSSVPYRQIRASYDDKTITVYQAYSDSIATAAVREQKLYASPNFMFTRMTWVKPSWCWMMYRSGYSTKDPRQSRILALKMSHQNFQNLLSQAAVCHGSTLTEQDRAKPVRVQWDPERGPGLEVLPYRSIQIGIGQALSKKWAEEWILSIEDVTDKALGLKADIEKNPDSSLDSLIEQGSMPLEKVYDLPGDLRRSLKMDI